MLANGLEGVRGQDEQVPIKSLCDVQIVRSQFSKVRRESQPEVSTQWARVLSDQQLYSPAFNSRVILNWIIGTLPMERNLQKEIICATIDLSVI